MGKVNEAEIDEALALIYQLQALKPFLKDDIGLLIEEVQILKARRHEKEALRVLEKAYALSPEDPEVLAELGLLRVHTAWQAKPNPSEQEAEGLNLIRRAITIQPTQARYHLYLARSFRKAERKGKAQREAEAIRSYHRAVPLASIQDFWTAQLRDYARRNIMDILAKYISSDKVTRDSLECTLNLQLEMSLEERISIFESHSPNFSGVESRYRNCEDGYVHLAWLHRARGDLKEASRVLRSALPHDKEEWWSFEAHYPKALAAILEEDRFDPDLLREVRAILAQ